MTTTPRGASRNGQSSHWPIIPLLRQFSLYSIANTFAHMLEPYGQFLIRHSLRSSITTILESRNASGRTKISLKHCSESMIRLRGNTSRNIESAARNPLTPSETFLRFIAPFKSGRSGGSRYFALKRSLSVPCDLM